MRIAVVMVGGLHPSGREQVVPCYVELFSRLARRHDVHAFVLRHLPAPVTYDLRGFTVHDLGRPWAGAGLGRVAQWRALRTAMTAAGPFHVVHGVWGDPPGLLAAMAGRAFGIPSLVTCTSGEFVSLPEIGYGLQRTFRGRAAVRVATRLASRVHVASAHAATLAARLGVTTTTIPVGVPRDGAAAVERPEGPPWRLLQVASLNRVKDQARLVDAMALLAATTRVHLDLVGEDTLGGELQQRAQAAGVADHITFHGFLPQDALAPLRARAHVYVQSSRHEGAGVAVLEAAAAAIPVVGTRVGYLADWAPLAAHAVDDPSPAGFADAVASLLAGAGRRRQLAGAAYAFAVAHDADWSADAIERLYQDLLGAARRDRR